MKKYDFIFGIGRACACSQALRLAGLQLLSLPWDWLATTPNGPDFDFRLDIIESGFADWLQEEDLKFVSHHAANGKDQYKNLRYPIVYPHDFPRDVPLHESFPAVKAKYDRRVARFKRLMSEAKDNVLAVYMDTPVSPFADVKTCREAQSRLQKLYPHVKVDFLMISLEYGRSFDDRIVEHLEGGFTHVAFDFKDYRPGKFDFSVDLVRCAEVMKSLATVRDYRSRAEIKAMNERTRKQKMQELGAKNAWEYFQIRRRRELGRIADWIRVSLARLRRKKYDHVFPFGMNCEPAYRFSLAWGFVDSNPYAWCLTTHIKDIADTLTHPERIGSEGYSWTPQSLMWKCNATGLLFHGRTEVKADDPPLPPETIEADRVDLTQRNAYLNDKFTRILSDHSSKALILRLHTNIALKDDINEQIDRIQRALETRGARNYTLVVVTERVARGRISAAPNRVVRSIKAFNPGDAVAKEHLGDPIGWKALYTEFSPAKILPKRHPFKFENA